MADAATATGSPVRPVSYGSMSRDRRWAMRWSYFFLVLFAIFFLTPPLYMLLTSLKTSGEISAAANPWWVYHPTLENYTTLLSKNDFLTFFRNSAREARIQCRSDGATWRLEYSSDHNPSG